MAPDTASGAVNALTVDSKLLGAFWELASVDKNRREEAARLLADGLKREHAPAGAGVSRSSSDVQLTPVETYCMKRLARGLSSGRKGARQGFALALTGTLAALDDITGSQALRLIREFEEPITGSTKGKEAKDIYLGDLFAFAAICRALRDRMDAGGAPPDAAVIGSMIEELAQLAGKKGYLKEGSAAVARDLLHLLDKAAVADAIKAAPSFSAWLCSPAESADATTVFLALSLWDTLPAATVSACKVLPGKAADKLAFFSREHLGAVHSALLTASSTHPRMHSAWGALLALLPRLHAQPADAPSKGASGAPTAATSAAAVALWEEVCERSLFGSSHERKYLGFELFNRLVPRCSVDALPALFSNTFMRCLVNNLSKEDNLLHSTARHCLQKLLSYVQSPEGEPIRAPVTAALQRFGGGRFDRLTQTDAVQKLTADLSGASVKVYVANLKQTFLTGVMAGPAAPGARRAGGEEAGAGGDAGAAGRRAWAVDQLCGVCKSASTQHAVQLAVLRFLTAQAFFDVTKAKGAKIDELKAAPEPPLAPATREARFAARSPPLGARAPRRRTMRRGTLTQLELPACASPGLQMLASRVLGLVADLIAAEHASPEAAGAEAARKAKALVAKAKASGEEETTDAEAAVAGLVADAVAEARRKAQEAGAAVKAVTAFIDKLEKAPSAALAKPLGDAGAEARGLLRALLADAERAAASGKVEGNKGKQVDGVCLLASVLLLAQLAAPASVEGVAADLAIALRKALRASGVPVTAPEGAESEDDDKKGDEPHFMDVLVDALLALLSRPSALVRLGCERVFRGFAEDLTPGALQALLRVIGKTGGKRRGPAGEDEEDDEEEEEEGSDADAEEGDEDAEMEDAEDGSDDDEEDEGKGGKAAGKGRAASGKKEESDGGGSDSDGDDEGLDDDAMLRMDAALGAMVGAAVGAKKDRKAAADEQLHFRFRALSLLEGFVKACPDSPLLVKCILPLLRALASAAAGPYASTTLAERLTTLLAKTICKGPGALRWGDAGTPVDEVRETYQTCMRLASRSSIAPVAKAGAQCCQYLLRVLSAAAAEGGAASAEELVRAALTDYLTSKKCRLPHAFFTSTFEKFPTTAARVAGAIGDWLQEPPSTNSGRAEHMLIESLKLLSAALRHKSGSAAAEEALEQPRLEKVLRGVAAALGRPVGKAKRRVEALKAAAAAVEAVARMCGTPGAQLPQGGLKAVREALQAAAAADGEEGGAAGKAKGQLTRIEGALNRAVAAAAGGGGGAAGKASGKKAEKKRKEGAAPAAIGAAPQEKKAKKGGGGAGGGGGALQKKK